MVKHYVLIKAPHTTCYYGNTSLTGPLWKLEVAIKSNLCTLTAVEGTLFTV